MATIPKSRIRVIASATGRRSFYQNTRMAASQSPVPGDLLQTVVVGTAHQATVANTRTTTTFTIGIAEKTIASTSLGDQMPTTIALPGYRYEISANSSVTTGNLYARAIGVDNATLGVLLGAYTSLDSTSIFIPVGFKSNFGVFEVNRVKGQAATSETAGRNVTPNTGEGVSGDTSPRMVVCFWSGACAMFR